jgi:hypothetical protein
LGIEHQDFLEHLGDADNFQESLPPSKEIFDLLQDCHHKTLILLVQDYPDYIKYVHEQGCLSPPLHLKNSFVARDMQAGWPPCGVTQDQQLLYCFDAYATPTQEAGS